MGEELVCVPARILERVYRAVIALRQPLGPELAEAIEEMYRAVGDASDQNPQRGG